MNNQNRVLTVVLIALIVGMVAGYALALNPTFITVIQPGSLIDTATETVFTDGTSFFAKNYQTGAIDYSGTNASTIIQNSINYAQGIGGAVAFLPGQYPISSTLLITAPVNLISAPSGFMGTTVYGARLYATSGIANMITITISAGSGNDAVSGGITGLFLDCASKASVGLNITGTNDVALKFDKLSVKSCNHLGIYIGENHSIHFYSLHLAVNGATKNDGGIMLNQVNAVNFYALNSEANGGSGVIIAGGYDNNFFGGVIEGNHYHGIYGYGTSQHVTIEGFDFESNNQASAANINDINISGGSVAYWNVQNNKFSSTLVKYCVFVNAPQIFLINDRCVSTPKIFWSFNAMGLIQLDVPNNIDLTSYVNSWFTTIINTNPQAFGTTTPAVPASTTYYFNNLIYDVTIYLTGTGTVTGIYIQDGGSRIQKIASSVTDGQWWVLHSRMGIRIDYSVVPSWKFYGN